MTTPNLKSALAKLLAESAGHPSFPEPSTNYLERFSRIDEHLNVNVHPHINTGPAAREAFWLTDHGPQHIATVIRRAGELVTCRDAISPYEAYILLLACHFHDVGNIFARAEHERKVGDVMFNLDKTLIGEDVLEKRVICHIAMAHGGHVNDDKKNKDTIGSLPYDRTTKSAGIDVKKLAAILRFADELADDKTRTSRFLVELTGALHPGSEIYHAYAAHLRPTRINHDARSVDVHFELNDEAIQKVYIKDGIERYLFEEILDRTLKMHREHIYCSRFMLPHVLIERISVQIDVCTKNYSHVLGQIQYAMEPLGYPGSPSSLGDICPMLSGVTGAKLAVKVARIVSNQSIHPYAAPLDLLASNAGGQS